MTDLTQAIEVLKKSPPLWAARDYSKDSPIAPHIATILNAVASGALIPKADPGDDAGLVKELREFGHYPALRQAAADRIEALIAERDALAAREAELERAISIVSDEATSAEIPGGYLPRETPDWHRGYDAAIQKARAALAKKETKE